MPAKERKIEKTAPRVSRNSKHIAEKTTEPSRENTLLGGAPVESLAAPLLAWYRENSRPLPWRGTGDAYRIWLSEIMLQQTRIEAVRPYYARFLAAAPTVADLAALPDEELMKLWEGLGYYSRARNLKRAALAIVERHRGSLPADYEALRALPGIGEYTAGAIGSIAYGLPTPAVDGNVLRVMARLLHDEADILRPDTKRRMTDILSRVYASLCGSDAEETASPACGQLTEALMELGETVCPPNRPPLCKACPLHALCRAAADGSHDRIPYRAPKKEKRIEKKLVLLLSDEEGCIVLRRRPEEGLLGGLWEFPTLDLFTGDTPDADTLARLFAAENGLFPEESLLLAPARHLFTHIEWRMQGIFLNVKRQGALPPDWTFATREELRRRYALPSAFRAYLSVALAEE